MQEAALRLKAELESRQSRNPSYSLRSFARWLQLSPTQVSQILSGKRTLTPKTAALISDRIGLSPMEKIEFLSQASHEISNEMKKRQDSKIYSNLDEDQFRTISEWYHMAILSLTKLSGAKADARWIAQQLGITSNQANDAVTRLRRLGLLSEAGFRQISSPLYIASQTPSSAIRKYHQGNLNLAAAKIEEIPMELREFQSVTLAVNASRITQFRKMLDRFLTDATESLEKGSKDEVYALNVQFFPLTKSKKE